MAHVSETCEATKPHLLTHVHTTAATVHEAQCTEPIQQALLDKQAPPKLHLVDAAYVDAPLLLSSHQHQGIDLMGPTRPNSSWQTKVEGAYSIEQFAIDWERQQVICPQGKISTTWTPQADSHGNASISVNLAPFGRTFFIVDGTMTSSQQGWFDPPSASLIIASDGLSHPHERPFQLALRGSPLATHILSLQHNPSRVIAASLYLLHLVIDHAITRMPDLPKHHRTATTGATQRIATRAGQHPFLVGLACHHPIRALDRSTHCHPEPLE